MDASEKRGLCVSSLWDSSEFQQMVDGEHGHESPGDNSTMKNRPELFVSGQLVPECGVQVDRLW